MPDATWDIRSPESEAEYSAYYHLRWTVLRRPWDQPRGSEQDAWEDRATHAMLVLESGEIAGVGRLHRRDDGAGQIRFMAVAPSHRRQGVAAAILEHLEQRAAELGMRELWLNARDAAVGFYLSHGYADRSEAPTVFGIPHRVMRKTLS